MLRALFKGMKLVLALPGAVVVVAGTYFVATIVGAVVPATPAGLPLAPRAAMASLRPEPAAPGREKIYLLTTLLHADIAIPADVWARSRFSFLADTGVPVGHPAVKFLVFGWGSRAFYTETPHLSDIRPGPTLKAITGDDSVLHVTPATDVSKLPNAIPISLPAGGIGRLADFIEASFRRGRHDEFMVAQTGFGVGDVFYEARGRFDILSPCNVWVANGLRTAGIPTGLWTPTTHSLKLGLSLHAPFALAD